MDAAQDRTGGGFPRAAAASAARGSSVDAGRIVVHPRVLEKVAQEAAASAFRVERSGISVDVSEGSRGVALRVATPLPVPDLDDTTAIAAGEPVLTRVAVIQEELKARVAHLIGRDVSRVDVTVTGAVIARKRRVK